ncbi:transporter substrate-binding domain-containing protein [uncultured Stenotrophomonas sp.]|uniref:transporter substrate-binding domain-containing protein n=1 Tax=uncultured Stenotrophomonas sp. TaxID=165438 RepID=UPI0025F2ED58|nr:transporter substrate-binding domain-containing protein [uncultured Stenotrophomonas sp.]
MLSIAAKSHMVSNRAFIRAGLLLVALLSLLAGSAQATEVAREISLLARASASNTELEFRNGDEDWLRAKGVLVLGVASPSFIPLEVFSGNDRFEGVTADAFGAIGEMLGVELRVIRFPDRSAALRALEQGAVDMVGSANSYELTGHPIRLTERYAEDTPVIYMRKAERRRMPPALAGMRIAVAEDYLPQAAIRHLYPDAVISSYRSREQALASLAFGSADLYLGDMVFSNYLVNLSYFNHVRTMVVPRMDTDGFAFAVREDAATLERVVNLALAELKKTNGNEILKRWSGGGGIVQSARIELSAVEQRWIDENPVVRFVASNDTAPLSYFDTDGRFSGLSADIMRVIAQRTGVEFEPVRVSRLDQQMAALEAGTADVTMLVPTASRAQRFSFSRPFVQTSFGIVTREGNGSPVSLGDLRGMRIALPARHALREMLLPASDYQFVETDTLAAAMGLVNDGKADATIAFLPMALYYTSVLHDGKLRVSDVVEDTPARLAIATRKDLPELASIIDKAVMQIPPDEVDIFQSRWRPRPDVSPATWTDFRSLIYKVTAGMLLLVLVSLIWNVHIRSQYRRRQVAEDALGEQLNFMRSLINGTPHPIYVRDEQGRLVTCNTNYLDMLAVTETKVLGKTSMEGAKLDPLEAQSFHEDYLWVMANGKPLEVDRTLHLPGRVLSIYHWIYPYFDSQGQAKGVVCGWIDVSDRLHLMEELRRALAAADQSSRAKTTFLATMSHEIRTPMSAIIGMLELAQKHADQGRLDRQAIAVAYDSAHGLLELIGDILDVVRIESGHVSLSPKHANLREMIESVARVFKGLARQKTLHLILELDPSVDCDVSIDPMRFKQVLSNLVGNAIKFTDRGQVTIRVRTVSVAEAQLRLQLEVADTGIGIADADIARLFDPFAQADHGHSTRGGTGLGLPICRFLCELMGGDISIRSSLGEGTTVMLNLPLEVLPAIPAGVDSVPTLDATHPSLKVLVVDDHSANRSLLTQQLEFLGQSVRSAADGREGLDCWLQGGVDVVVTDCNMPVMNGHEMARAIRRHEKSRGQPPCVIIGFTANAQPEERAKCIASGMDDCLFKPVSLSTLSSMLVALGGVTGASPTQVRQRQINDIASTLWELTGGDTAMTRSLVAEAHGSFVRDLAELEALLPEFEPRAMSNLVHRINGGVRLLQVPHLMDICERIELLCDRPEVEPDEITANAQFIASELPAIIAVLAAMCAPDP